MSEQLGGPLLGHEIMRISELNQNQKAQPPKNIPERDRVAVRFCLTWLGLPATMKHYRNLDPRVNWQELYYNIQNPSFDVSMRVPGGRLVAKEIRASDRAAARQVVERDYPKYEFVEWLR